LTTLRVGWKLVTVSSPDDPDDEERRRLVQLVEEEAKRNPIFAKVFGLVHLWQGPDDPPPRAAAAAAATRFSRINLRGRPPSPKR